MITSPDNMIEIANNTADMIIANDTMVFDNVASTSSINEDSAPAPASSSAVTSSAVQVSSTSKKGILNAPPEIRELIFAQSFPEHTSLRYAQIPALFKALEGKPELYNEAVATYSRTSTFHIFWQDNDPIDTFPYEMIHKLHIYVYYYKSELGSDGEYHLLSNPSDCVAEFLSSVVNVTELKLKFSQHKEDLIFENIRLCLGRFSKLRKFVVEMQFDDSGDSVSGYDHVHEFYLDEFDLDDYNEDGNDSNGGGDVWIVEDDMGEIGISEERSGEAGVNEVGGNEIGVSEIGGNEVGVSEDGGNEEWSMTELDRAVDSEPYHPICFTAINQGMGFQGEFTAIDDRIYNPHCTSVWEARPGQVLVWRPENVQVEF